MPLQDGISTVQPEDFDQIVEVWEASVRATHHFVLESDIQIFRPIVRNVLPDLTLACVRDDNGMVAGYIAVGGDKKIEMLFIDPQWRGQGIGSRLIRHAVDELGSAEVDVNEQNEQALGFYLKMGFEVVSRDELDGMGKPYPILHMRLSQ